MNTSPLQIAIQRLREQFLGKIEFDDMELDELAVSYQNEPSDHTRTRIRQIAHRLAGAGGLYGFGEISNKAAELEKVTADPCSAVEAAVAKVGDLRTVLAAARRNR